MMTRNIVLLLVLLVLAVFSSSCSDQSSTVPEEQQESQQKSQNDILEKKQSIKVYIKHQSSRAYLRQALDLFKVKFPGVIVEERAFEGSEEYINKLSTELMAGKGPDLIHLMSVDMDIRKLSNTGVFSDLNAFIEQDNEFNMDSYFDTVMDCGVIDKKRYFIPVSFFIPVFLTTDELMQSNSMVFDEKNWSWEYLGDFMVNYCMGESNQPEKYFSTYDLGFYNYLQTGGIEFIDFDRKKTLFHTSRFKEILAIYKKTVNLSKVTATYGQMMSSGMLFSANFINVLDPLYAYKVQSEIKFYTKGTVRMMPYPTYSGELELTASPGIVAAINNKSENKTMAYELLKILLSDDMQKSESMFGVPVNKSTFFSMLEEYSKDTYYRKFRDTYRYPLDETLVQDMKNIISGIQRCVIEDLDIANIIDTIAGEYAGNQYSLEECIRKMENKVILYLNE